MQGLAFLSCFFGEAKKQVACRASPTDAGTRDVLNFKIHHSTASVKPDPHPASPLTRGRSEKLTPTKRQRLTVCGQPFSLFFIMKIGKKVGRKPKREWFECDLKTLEAAFLAVQTRTANLARKTQSFGMRPEQAAAVEQTAAYFEQHQADIGQGRRLHYLWNAKMRFGKTFAAYQLAKRMGWTKILIMTFKPAVESAWQSDLTEHQAFEGWQYHSKSKQKSLNQQGTIMASSAPEFDQNRPIVCFASFQDLLGKDKETGKNKANNDWIHAKHWDCIIFDEYHFGSQSRFCTNGRIRPKFRQQ
jgi:hypothetical protein